MRAFYILVKWNTSLTVGVVCLSVVMTASLEARTWTAKDGRKLEAELIDYDAATGVVKIRRSDGNEFTLPQDRLSDADIDYLKMKEEEKATRAAMEKEKAGKTISSVSKGDHKVPFHTYYPKSYDGTGKLPMLILFSPGGGGNGILKNFREPADELGWILVGCDKLKNGMDDKLGDEIFAEMLSDIEKAVVHDPERVHMGGMSGGAMRAYDYSARFERPWKGIVACGGWLGGTKNSDQEYAKTMAVAMVNGDNDKNANAWIDKDTAVLKRRRCKVKVFKFPGGHTVGPPATLLEAMKWIESQRDG